MIHYIYYNNPEGRKPQFVTIYGWEPNQETTRNYLQHCDQNRYSNSKYQLDLDGQKLFDRQTKDVYTLLVADDEGKPSLKYRTRWAYNRDEKIEWEDF